MVHNFVIPAFDPVDILWSNFEMIKVPFADECFGLKDVIVLHFRRVAQGNTVVHHLSAYNSQGVTRNGNTSFNIIGFEISRIKYPVIQFLRWNIKDHYIATFYRANSWQPVLW